MKKITRYILLIVLPVLTGCLPESAFKVALKLEDETTGKPITDAWVITIADVDYAPLREEPYNKAMAATRGITNSKGMVKFGKVEGVYFGQEPKDQLWLMLESRKPKVDRQITGIQGGSIFVFSKEYGVIHQPFAVRNTDPGYRGWYGGNESEWERKTITFDENALKKGETLVLKIGVPKDPKLVKGAFQTEFLVFMMCGMTGKTGATIKEKEALYNFFVRNMEEAVRTSDDPFFRHEYENLKSPEVKNEVINWSLAAAGNHDTAIHEWLTQKMIEQLPQEYAEVKQYARAVKQGVKDEDAYARAAHHFYNPNDGAGLGRYDNALKWGAIGYPNNPDNEWDLEDAAKYYREGDKEKAYKALGHVIHLLEDLSVPLHTHNIAHDKMFHGKEARFETYFSEFIKKNADSLPPEYWQTAETIKPATDTKQLFDNTAKLTFGSFTQDGQAVNFDDYYAQGKAIRPPGPEILQLMGKYLFPKTIKSGTALLSRFYNTLNPELSAKKTEETATDAGGVADAGKSKEEQATPENTPQINHIPSSPTAAAPGDDVNYKDKPGYKVAESTEIEKPQEHANSAAGNKSVNLSTTPPQQDRRLSKSQIDSSLKKAHSILSGPETSGSVMQSNALVEALTLEGNNAIPLVTDFLVSKNINERKFAFSVLIKVATDESMGIVQDGFWKLYKDKAAAGQITVVGAAGSYHNAKMNSKISGVDNYWEARAILRGALRSDSTRSIPLCLKVYKDQNGIGVIASKYLWLKNGKEYISEFLNHSQSPVESEPFYTFVKEFGAIFDKAEPSLYIGIQQAKDDFKQKAIAVALNPETSESVLWETIGYLSNAEQDWFADNWVGLFKIHKKAVYLGSKVNVAILRGVSNNKSSRKNIEKLKDIFKEWEYKFIEDSIKKEDLKREEKAKWESQK